MLTIEALSTKLIYTTQQIYNHAEENKNRYNVSFINHNKINIDKWTLSDRPSVNL